MGKTMLKKLLANGSEVPSLLNDKIELLIQSWGKERRSNKVLLATSDPITQTRTDSYNQIIALGKENDDVLPILIQRLENGDYFMNRAVLEISGISMDQINSKKEILGEQEISRRLASRYRESEVLNS